MSSAPGLSIARQKARHRKKIGPGAFSVGGTAYDAAAKRLSPMGGEFLPDGTQNAAFAEILLVTVNPSAGISREIEGRPCTYLGQSYIVSKVPVVELSFNVPIAQPLVIFSAPQADSVTEAAAQHQDTIWTAREVNP